MDVGLLNNRRERPLGLPTRLQQRGEVSSVADPGHLQLHRPYPRVPGALPVTVALSCASGTPLVTPCAYVLFYFHLHECLGEHPDALLEEVCVLIDHRLAQQLRESYPQFIGHRASSFGRLVSSEGTTRWPSSSTAFAFYTLTRTLPRRLQRSLTGHRNALLLGPFWPPYTRQIHTWSVARITFRTVSRKGVLRSSALRE